MIEDTCKLDTRLAGDFDSGTEAPLKSRYDDLVPGISKSAVNFLPESSNVDASDRRGQMASCGGLQTAINRLNATQ